MDDSTGLGSESESDLLDSLNQFFSQYSADRTNKNKKEQKRRADLKSQYDKFRRLLNLSPKTSKLQVLEQGCARVLELTQIIKRQQQKQQHLIQKLID